MNGSRIWLIQKRFSRLHASRSPMMSGEVKWVSRRSSATISCVRFIERCRLLGESKSITSSNCVEFSKLIENAETAAFLLSTRYHILFKALLIAQPSPIRIIKVDTVGCASEYPRGLQANVDFRFIAPDHCL